MGQYKVFQNDFEMIQFLLNNIKVDPVSIKYFTVKQKILFFYFEKVKNKLCNIIKQDMISVGGDAAVSRDVARFKPGIGNVLLMGTIKQFNRFIEKAKFQPTPIRAIGKEINYYLENINKEGLYFKIKNKKYFCKKRTYLMGIINITPDSFYDGNRYNDFNRAIRQVDKLVQEGADILDIGGESTRPGSEKVTVQEEISRVLPVIKYIKKHYKIPLSLDTYKSEVARVGFDHGVAIINDISGLRFDKKMADCIGKNKASVVLMHIKGTPRTMQKSPEYQDLMGEIKNYLEDSIKIALDNGIKFDNIIIDPGIGFGKTVEHNYIILKKINELKVLNRPVLIGLSRKSLIGKVIDKPAEERLNGTIVLNTLSLLNGADIVRVHDVKAHREMIKLMEFYFKVY